MAEETPKAPRETRVKRRSRIPIVGILTVLAGVVTIVAGSFDVYDRFRSPAATVPADSGNIEALGDSEQVDTHTSTAEDLPDQHTSLPEAIAPPRKTPDPPGNTTDPARDTADPPEDTADPPEDTAGLPENTVDPPRDTSVPSCVLTPARPTCRLGAEALRVAVRYPDPQRAIISITGTTIEPFLETVRAQASGTLPLGHRTDPAASVEVTHHGTSQEVEVTLVP